MKIQPIDPESTVRTDHPKPVAKSRLKRLFERQFPGVLRISSADKLAGAAGDGKDVSFSGDPEPSSVALAKMVQSFMEDSKCGKNHRCHCFHGHSDDLSDDDLAADPPIASDAAEVLKSLVLCSSVAERNLLADVSRIIEKLKAVKGKEASRSFLINGLRSLGYDAAACRSRWEKSPSFPAGEYEYVDVVVGGDRILIDVDFRSEFEVARSTKGYRAVLQSLPLIFVGTADRVAAIVGVVSDAAKQSLKKKGLHFPPWRHPDFMRAKWLAPYDRSPLPLPPPPAATQEAAAPQMAWRPPAVRPKAGGRRVVTGLASVLREKA